jgi:hypothetical protein
MKKTKSNPGNASSEIKSISPVKLPVGNSFIKISLSLLALSAFTIVVFANSLHNYFITNLDDNLYNIKYLFSKNIKE